MSKCKNMKMLKYTAPSMEIQPVQAMGLILSTSIETSIEGGNQETAQAPRRRVF
jgi:hypothetical protein